MGYWEDRQSETLDAILANAEISADEIADVYAKSSFYINEKIQGIFDRYRAKYDLSIQEATELLNRMDDPSSFDEMLNVLGSSKGAERRELLKKLESPAYRYRINRLQELQNSIDDMMTNIYNQEKDISTAHYIDTAHESYYRTTYNIQHDIGYEYDFATVDSKKVDTLLANRWSGANYSERIWNNTQTLANELKENLLLGILTGMSVREMRDRLVERFQVSNFKARRLIETESAFISTMMDIEAYKEADVDTLKFIAIHDFKTSKICRSLDSTYVKLNEAVAGKNVPPMHPHCRSRTEPVIDEEFDKNMKRRVKKADGTYEIVNANETYQEWYDRTVKEQGKDTVETLEKKIKYKYSDKEQFYRYRNVLGDEFVPDSLDKFQQIKYSDENKWKDLKYNYRTVNRYKVDYGKVKASEILELDKAAFEAKDLYMTRKAQKGNVASMKIDDEIFIASSQISSTTDLTYSNYKGDKDKLILSPKEKKLNPHTIENPYIGHENEYSRDIDTEYKFFEYIYDKVLKGELKNKNIIILSQKDMCFSCESVYNELISKKEIIDANIKINVVSGKRNDSWDYRNYKSVGLNNLKNKGKEKN